jgi:cephalosporin hydroxylase
MAISTSKQLTTHIVYMTVIALLVAFIVLSWGTTESRFQAALSRHTDNFEHTRWLGHELWQPLPDAWTLQEVIAEVKPALLIETGTYKGGSSLYIANLMDLLGHGRVITIDIKKFHNLSHPRITYLIGDSVSAPMVAQINTAAREADGPIMVLLDSAHHRDHVLKEMEAYGPLVTPGSYLHVQDGVIDQQNMFATDRPGPLRAIEAFLPNHREFVVDEARVNQFLITHHPKGWLRRVARK